MPISEKKQLNESTKLYHIGQRIQVTGHCNFQSKIRGHERQNGTKLPMSSDKDVVAFNRSLYLK